MLFKTLLINIIGSTFYLVTFMNSIINLKKIIKTLKPIEELKQ